MRQLVNGDGHDGVFRTRRNGDLPVAVFAVNTAWKLRNLKLRAEFLRDPLRRSELLPPRDVLLAIAGQPVRLLYGLRFARLRAQLLDRLRRLCRRLGRGGFLLSFPLSSKLGFRQFTEIQRKLILSAVGFP